MNTLTHDDGKWLLNKVPQVTFVFWLIKILATTVGETAADFLNFDLGFGLSGTSLVMGALLAVFLAVQMRARRYVPWLYWTVVVFVSIVGTLITDNLTDKLDVPLQSTTLAFGIALAATFILWYAAERTLSIQTIHRGRREAFYWAAILLTFALGTAAGDWVAEGLAIGYANSALMFGGMIGLVAATHYLFKADAVAAFWIAYVLTRPLGASCGDLLAQPLEQGGLGLGTVATTGAFLATILSLVLYLSATRKDAARPVPVHSDE